MIDPGKPRAGSTTQTRALRYSQGTSSRAYDVLATEEPMEIRLISGGTRQTVAVTMRTPGNDFELAAGFLFSEGILTARDEIDTITYCLDDDVDPEQRYNIVNVALRSAMPVALDRLERHFAMSSACGVCGKANLEALSLRGIAPVDDVMRVEAATILSLSGELGELQKIFRATGGLHAAALFESSGALITVREDVGRHNAVDKLIGWALMNGRVPLQNRILFVSGRSSFEILQKAAVARIPIVAAVSAPSSLAVDVAQAFKMTLIGFLRDGRFNVYAGEERLVL